MAQENAKRHWPFPALLLATFLIYFHSNPLAGNFYDYTCRIAGEMLQGRLGMIEPPPDWLNEMIPLNGRYYSAFPLGSVLTMLPLAAMKRLHLINEFPGKALAALTAGLIAVLLYALSGRYRDGVSRRLALTLFPVFGSWMWANLAFAGAWHLALGLAMAGQLGALYFILIRFRPLPAGICFAIAFGNRTELLLLSPLFLFLLHREAQLRGMDRWRAIDRFLMLPVLLGVMTLAYNHARFGSLFDFGYARIPGVLDEPWYSHGIFSLHAIPGNAYAMLIEPWQRSDAWPYLTPTGFGGSILLNCPFLLLLFRLGARDATLKSLSWVAILVLTFLLWCHGNPGGWQISYRYGMILLPWMFIVMLENGRPRVAWWEALLLALSIAINAVSTWLFLHTRLMSP
ncbi:MAG: hypothetical protein SF339_27950 [Blastocatellia bacterium]|nr:hypothetical protein [Blastocatellia bacterium]